MNIKAKYILFFLLLFAITSCKNFLENSFISNNSVSDITLGNKEEEVLEKLKKYDVFESTPFNLSYHHKGDKHYDVFKNDQKYFSLIFEDDKLSFVRVHSDSLVTYSDIRIGNTFEEIKKSDLRLYGFTEVNDGIRTQIEEYKEMYFIFDKRIDTYKLNNKAKLKEIWVGSYVPYITYDWITNKEDYGVVKDNMYTNKMFGFQLKIPEKCVVKTGKSTIPRVKELLHIYNDKKESFLSLKAIRVDKNKYEDGAAYLSLSKKITDKNFDDIRISKDTLLIAKSYYFYKGIQESKNSSLKNNVFYAALTENYILLFTGKHKNNKELEEINKVLINIKGIRSK